MNRTSRWLSCALIFSMGINLFALIFFIKHESKTRIPPGIYATLAPGLKEAFKKLPQSKREEMIINIKNSRIKVSENQKKIHDLREILAQALQEEPINKTNVASLQYQIEHLTNENTKTVQETIVQTLINLPRSEREKIVNKTLGLEK